MKAYKECHLTLDIKNEHCSIQENKESSHNMSHGENISKEKEDDCKIIVILILILDLVN